MPEDSEEQHQKQTKEKDITTLFKEMVEDQREKHPIALINDCVRAINTLIMNSATRAWRPRSEWVYTHADPINPEKIPSYEDLDNLEVQQKIRIAEAPNIPITYLLKLSCDPDPRVCGAVASNKNCPKELFLKLAQHDSLYVREELFHYQQNLPEEILNIIFETPELARAIAEDEKTPGYILRKLSKSSSVDIRAAVAGNQSTPFDVLINFGEKDKSRKVKEALKRDNPNTPISILRKLDRDKPVSENALSLIAEDPRTPAWALRRLAHENCEKVRIEISKNPHMPPEILEKLAEDPCRQVVKNVIGNPNTDISTLLTLADNKEYIELLILNDKVRQHIVEKVRTELGEDYVEILKNDSIYNLVAHINFTRKYENLGLLIARNLEIPKDILEKLAYSSDPKIRAAVGDNQNTSPDALEYLSVDDIVDVRCAVAGNSSTNPDYLINLSKDSEPEVRACVGANQKTPTTVIEKLITDENVEVRLSVASSPHTPIFLLLKLANNKDIEVRIAAMENEKFPRNHLKKYLQDPLLQIRGTAQAIFNTPLD